MTRDTDNTITQNQKTKPAPEKVPSVVPQPVDPQKTLDQIAADSKVDATEYLNDSVAPQGE